MTEADKFMIKRLDWDSAFFGFEVGVIDESITPSTFYGVESYHLIYYQSDSSDVPFLPNHEVNYSEKKITFSKALSFPQEPNLNISSFDRRSGDLAPLYELAHISGHQSRFFLDENFDSLTFSRLYDIWVDKSVNRTIADDVLVYKLDSKIVGFITVKFDLQQRRAKIGLLGVSAKGKGVGSALLKEVERLSYDKGVHSIDVPTQDHNYLACLFYKKNGYLEHNHLYIHHCWKTYDPIQ